MPQLSATHPSHRTYRERLSELRKEKDAIDLAERVRQEVIAAHQAQYPGQALDGDLVDQMTQRLVGYRRRMIERELELLERLEETG